MSQMYHIYNGNILILVGGVYKCSKLKMLGFNVVPSATWDLDSRRHGTLTQSMASRGPGRRESRALLPYCSCYCYWKIISFAFLVCIHIDTKYVKWEQRSVNFLKFWSTLVHVHNCFQINFVPFFWQNEGKTWLERSNETGQLLSKGLFHSFHQSGLKRNYLSLLSYSDNFTFSFINDIKLTTGQCEMV